MECCIQAALITIFLYWGWVKGSVWARKQQTRWTACAGTVWEDK